MANWKITKIADLLQDKLLSDNFHIRRYDSKDSIYIEIDYNACGSIRISDHKSKYMSLYQFNILPEKTDFVKNIFSINDENYDLLIFKIQSVRNTYKFKYGHAYYERIINDKKTSFKLPHIQFSLKRKHSYKKQRKVI